MPAKPLTSRDRKRDHLCCNSQSLTKLGHFRMLITLECTKKPLNTKIRQTKRFCQWFKLVKFINFLTQERLPHSFSTHFPYPYIEPEVVFYRKCMLSQECHESRYTVSSPSREMVQHSLSKVVSSVSFFYDGRVSYGP